MDPRAAYKVGQEVGAGAHQPKDLPSRPLRRQRNPRRLGRLVGAAGRRRRVLCTLARLRTLPRLAPLRVEGPQLPLAPRVHIVRLEPLVVRLRLALVEVGHVRPRQRVLPNGEQKTEDLHRAKHRRPARLKPRVEAGPMDTSPAARPRRSSHEQPGAATQPPPPPAYVAVSSSSHQSVERLRLDPVEAPSRGASPRSWPSGRRRSRA